MYLYASSISANYVILFPILRLYSYSLSLTLVVKKKTGVHPEKQEVEEEYIASVQIRRPPYIPPTLPPQIHRYGYSWHLKYHPPSLP